MTISSSSASSDETGKASCRLLIVGTSGGGGDLQPLLAIAAGLRERGHDVRAFGDNSVRATMANLGVETIVAGPEHDLASAYAAVAAEAANRSLEDQTKLLVQRLLGWAARLGAVIGSAVEQYKPDILVTSLFGSAAVRLAAERQGLPWAAVNSTFYIGPNPPRRPELDFGARAPLFREFFEPNLSRATLVLHASDREFDFGFRGLPAHHHYVGPLFYTPPTQSPTWLDEKGHPWVLVALSSHTQDDLPIARAAVAASRDLAVRVIMTVGEHTAHSLGQTPSNVRVQRYIAHSHVLERAVLMVSHAGHGSVMRGLWHGVPMVLVPWGRDQGGVAERAKQLGVAVVISRGELTEDLLARSMSRILADHAVRQTAAAVSERLQRDDPVAAACTLLSSLKLQSGTASS